jgi:hypothetical protein
MNKNQRKSALLSCALIVAGMMTAQLFMGYSSTPVKPPTMPERNTLAADSICAAEDAELYEDCDATDGKVYICTGGSSKCYHSNSGCRGLNKCSKEIKVITENEAQQMGRRKCKICY